MDQAATVIACLEALCRDFSITLDGCSPDTIIHPESHADFIRKLFLALEDRHLRLQLIKRQDDLPSDYSGPLLAQIDQKSWVYVPDFSAVQKDSLTLFDPQAGGHIKVKSSQFRERWCGPAMLCMVIRQDEVEPPVNPLVPLSIEIAHRYSSGLQCLCLVGRHHGLELDEGRLAHEYALTGQEPSLETLAEMARGCGLHSRISTLDWEKVQTLQEAFPVLVQCRGKGYALLCNIQRTKDGQPGLLALFPHDGQASGNTAPLRVLDKQAFEDTCDGQALLLKRRYSLSDERQPFGLAWFIPEFLRHKRIFAQIALAVTIITGISLLTPIFFQIVIDKVLPHHTYTTLNVLAAGMLGVILYHCLLEFLRSYLLYYTTTKIDINLSMRTFHHLMRLPMNFFESIPAGLILKHMQQTEKIRGFLSGNLFFTILDLFSLLIFIPFLVLYSLHLTGIVIGFSLLMALVVITLIKPFQRRLDTLYKTEGKRQSRLVESIRGINTIKSMAVEPQGEKEWNNVSAFAIQSYFNVGKISITAKALSQFLEMSMNMAIIWYGAHLVFDMQISIGALIAFQMVSGRVSAPLVKLVSLVHEYQQVALSVRMLGVVMNTPEEQSGGNLRTPIRGDIDFSHVSFQYRPELQPAINDFSLHIRAGEILGIVGRSGSGKSTLSKLMQAIHIPQRGFIKIDGTDIRELDKMHLRRNISIVLQENYFFHGTIRDNIRLAQPAAQPEEVISVARMAGAHDFISALHTGYDTILEENAVNLSGGQKQRLAIARALLTQPRVLILDEATSALDPESEWEIQKNLRQMAEGKTVIIISHRLSLMRQAHRVLVLDEGSIIDQGRHDELLARPGLYRNFWQQQMGG